MIVGTRGSQLALAQTEQVCAELTKVTKEAPKIEVIKTKGDKITNSQLYNMDSKGLFTKELDKALLEEEVDFTVHSFKDLPTELDDDLEIIAVPKRESPNDVLISNKTWDDLNKGSTLGSSSLRREAFCNHYKKGFKLKPLRGNVETRIKKVLNDELDATIMAEAGLKRLNLTQYIKQVFPTDYITPAAGQGAIAVIIRKDSDKKEIFSKLNDHNSMQEVFGEKAVLEELGVGCQWPIGCLAQLKDKKFNIYSILLTRQGEILKECSMTGSINDSKDIGRKIGKIFEDYIWGGIILRTVNVGVIGVGAMGVNHARVYYKLENANLLAVSDVSERSLNKVCKKYNTKGYTDYKELLENPEIEVVSVCVPTTFHHGIVMEAIAHGKHVLVEKPIAFTLEEATEMINAAEEKGVILATGHVERFNPAVQKAKELIENDVIGDVVSASAKRVGPFPPRIQDVGVTIDLAIHDLDVMYYLFDEDVTQVYGTMGSILDKCDFEDHAEIMVNFNNDATGMLEVNWLTPYKRRQIEVTGTDGIISVDYIEQSIDVYGKFAQDIQIKHEEPLKEELKSFLESVVNNEKPVITGEDGLNALKMVIAATKSSKEHKPISFDEL